MKVYYWEALDQIVLEEGGCIEWPWGFGDATAFQLLSAVEHELTYLGEL